MPDRYVFSCLVSSVLLISPALARAQLVQAISIQAGPAFFMKPHWFTQGNALVQGWAPTAQVQAERDFPAGPARLRWQVFGRNGWWAREDVSRAFGYEAAWGGQLYQLGGGLRYYDWLNLGRWLEPFVGLTASGAYVSSRAGRGVAGMVYLDPVPTHRRWTALLGAEVGVQAWLTEYSGPTLTLTVYRSLRPYFTNFTTTQYLPLPPPQGTYAYEVRTHPLRGQAALQLGWRWQLPFICRSLPSYRTPRYSQ